MTKSTRRVRARYRARNSLLFKAAAVGACLGAMATVNKVISMWAERKHLPKGRFLDVDGVKLHYLDQGSGPVLVFLHGNGSMVDDFTASGLISEADKHYRVIAFDRPGFGHSSRPRDTVWTASAQARLIQQALSQLGVSEYSVFGHSWGASVAIALGIRHADHVRSLVLASGYYYPVPMMSMFLLTAPALPLIGDILAHTIAPAISRVFWQGLIAKIFKPAKAPKKFRLFPKSMALRPSQLRASAVETALLMPDAIGQSSSYRSIKMPVMIIAGAEDDVINISQQSARLHRDIPGSFFRSLPSQGHMIHQSATSDVLAAVKAVVQQRDTDPA